jgi:tetratricopeptide (TPR) repeat protein
MGKREKRPKLKTGAEEINTKRSLSFNGVFRAALILLLVFIAYLPVLKAGFIWDDDDFLTNNALIKASDGLYRFWFTTEPPDYFPLTSTMLWIEWRVWGGNAMGYHVINILLHGLTSILLWMVLKEMGIPWSWLGGLLFGLHPVAAESVAWITERKNTLPMVFYILSFLFFIRSEKKDSRSYYYGSLVIFFLALLSKTSVVMLPIVLGFFLWWKHGKMGWAEIKKLLPFLGLSCVLGLVTIWFQYNRAIGEDVIRHDSLAERFVIAGWAVWFYLWKALLPIRLCFVYPRWNPRALSLVSFIPWMGIGILAVILYRKRRGWGRPFIFGLGYYLANLLPILGFFNIYFMKYSLVADHWQYTALAGITSLATGLGGYYHTKSGIRAKQIVPAMGAAVTALFLVLTYQQSQIYRDAETLWKDTLRKNPKAGLALNNMGMICEKLKEWDNALYYYTAAMEAMPGDALILYNRGNACKETGNINQAILNYQKALSYKPSFFHAWNNLGLAYEMKGDLEKARECFERAQKIDPGFAKAYLNEGNLLASQKKYEEAISFYQKVLELSPENPDGHGNLANTLAEMERYEEALFHYEKALSLDPDNPTIKKNLGIALRKKGMKKN